MISALRPLGAMAVENSAMPGTPDVYYMHGWIELKECDNWPKRDTTPLRLPHFTKWQRAWLKRHAHLGGTCFVLLKVGELEWFLIDGVVASDRLDNSTQSEIRECSALTFTNGFDSKGFLGWITSNSVTASDS